MIAGPLDATVSDFWRLVWEKDVPVIAMLTKTFDFIKGTNFVFQPTLTVVYNQLNVNV